MDRKVRVDSGTYSDCSGSHVIDNVDGSDLQSTRTEVGLCSTVRDSDNEDTCTICQFLRFFYNVEPVHDDSHHNPRSVVDISSNTTHGGDRDSDRDERKRIPSSTSSTSSHNNEHDNDNDTSNNDIEIAGSGSRATSTRGGN